AGELLTQLARGGVLDAAGDDTLARGAGREQPADDGVDRLGPAAGESELRVRAMDQGRDPRASLVDPLPRELAEAVDARGVAVAIGQIYEHRLHDFRRGAGGG